MSSRPEPSLRRLDLDTWPRRRHFDFFRSFDNPFWNVTAEVDVTALHAFTSRPGSPAFSVAAFFLSLEAVNAVEALRLRIRRHDEVLEVVVLPRVHGGSTVLRGDETFGFCYFDYDPDFTVFEAGARAALEAAKRDGSFEPKKNRDDLVHYSILPWIRFTSFQHARALNTGDSVPKIVFGKHREAHGRRTMPVSIESHHALVDGLHVGRFFEHFETSLETCVARLSGRATKR